MCLLAARYLATVLTMKEGMNEMQGVAHYDHHSLQ